MPRLSLLLALGACYLLPFCAASVEPPRQVTPCSQVSHECRPVSESFVGLPNEARAAPDNPTEDTSSVLGDVFNALAVLQNTYLEPINGTLPSSIEWTGAVVGTIISGTLSTLSKSLDSLSQKHDWNEKEQLISFIFAHVTHYFFGQNTAAILNQAYDDVLWVVLGWLETIKFINLHSALHYPTRERQCLTVPTKLGSALGTVSWHGNHWVCTFATRARAFWDFASKGWDTNLCNGGMVWRSEPDPYKNAITNELWISASTSMYSHFPNDKFNQNWVSSKGLATNNPVYLSAAVTGYKWLRDVNMTNSRGLFVDGFHIDKTIPGNVKCDKRDEMVYTYNQGVVLTGQRGLFIMTGSASYLEEGHTLISAVINATGWDMAKNKPVDSIKDVPPGKLPPWRGIGRYGILEEFCDTDGTCSQDRQTFKGIFFHHLTEFCAPVEPADVARYVQTDTEQIGKVGEAHNKSCAGYLSWVKHNADAALATRDAAGRFGMWWGANIYGQLAAAPASLHRRGWSLQINVTDTQPHASEEPLVGRAVGRRASDLNDRGRGRTIETQAGGLALLRAYWELSRK
ncbi:hypothetical protein E4U53_007784 [Claviceps sorghi]|nr:hypothetical protein E4U53_007784 [Claviceps sorghi]